MNDRKKRAVYAALLLHHGVPATPNTLADFLTRELTSGEGKEEVLKALLERRNVRGKEGE